MNQKEPLKPLSRSKRRIFKFGAFLMALFVLALLEVGLRVFGYGKDYPLFIQDKNDKASLIINPEIGQKYFFNPNDATKALPRAFKKEKKKETKRLVIMGASTAIGYPYKYHGGFQNWLEYALNRTYPDQNFEIINTALTAVNSYTLRDFTSQIIELEPDAVLIYAGHNEYYGALGVGSTSSYGNSPWVVNLMLSLREMRIVQLITNTMLSFKSDEEKKQALDKNLMEKMVEDQKIPFDSDLYHAGIHQFETNLSKLLDELNSENVPTFLSTIVSNEEDLKPFISDSTSQKNSADFFFGKAKEQFKSENYKEAKTNFIKAKELDMLRFRAPEAMNGIIGEQAERFEYVTLVETKKHFETRAEKGIIGDNLLLEHVHPNLEGYGLIGHSFYQALRNSDVLPKSEKQLTFDELKNEMPVTAVDSLNGKFEVMLLKDGWPYYEPFPKLDVQKMSQAERISGQLTAGQIPWKSATEKLFSHYITTKDSLRALKVLESMSLRFPDQAVCYSSPGFLALELNQYEKANYLFSRAVELDSSQQNIAMISRKLIEAEQYTTTLGYLEKLKKQETGSEFANKVSEIVKKIIRYNELNSEGQLSVASKIELAKNHLLLGNRSQALVCLNSVLKTDPNNVEAKNLKSEIEK
ncbi:MAG: hypothetical protein AAF688_01225 [Bacteroidota bacterium]